MGVKGGPDIITEGLVFHLDAAGAISGKGYDPEGLRVEYLIVGGGGAGGRHHGGGGGAGGLLYGRTVASHGANTIVIGAGGAKNTGTNGSPNGTGRNGQNSAAFGFTSIGGGGGGQYNSHGGSGGSGGGPTNWETSRLGGTGTTGQGFPALNGSGSYNTRGGGGGSGGSPTSLNNYNNGGIGKYYGYTFGRSLGEDGWFAGGGAAGTYGGVCSGYSRYTGANIGGLGGGAIGGYGCHGNSVQAQDGQSNTGGGGGGQPAYNRLAGNGGSGIVIIKYKGAQRATGGDSIITRNGFTIHVFTSSGTFTVGDRVAGLSTNKIVGSLENMGSNDYKTGNKGYFSFDGSNQAIKLPNFDVSTLGGNFTICSLIKPIGSISLVFSSLDVSLSSQTKNINFYFYEAASYGISSNAMRLQFGKDSWAWQVYGSNGLSLLKNNWYFVAVTAANLNTNTHTIKFYVNDQSVNATKWQFGSPTPINYGGDISNSTFLARSHSASDPTYINTYHEINIANVKIYNKTLSDNEVLDNYNATKGRYGL